MSFDPIKLGLKVKKIAEFESDLKLNGKCNGYLKAKFELNHRKYFKQKIAGVMTEGGLIRSSPIINKRKSKHHQSLKELNLLIDELNSSILNLESTKDILIL